MDRFPPGQRRAGSPQRIIRRRDQNLVSVIQKRLHRQIDQLADAISRINIIHRHIRNILGLTILHDRLARRKDPSGIRISLRVLYVCHHIFNDFLGRRKTEGRRIPNIQLQDTPALSFHTPRFLYDRAAHIVQYIVQFRRFIECSHKYTLLLSSEGQASIILSLANSSPLACSNFSRSWDTLRFFFSSPETS